MARANLPPVLFERERPLLFAANTACRRYKGLGWSAAGNSNNMILGASKTAVLGFGKRGAGKHGESKAQGLPAERTAAQILAITVPLATAVTSIAWAIAVYLMVRERYRAQVEMARFAAEARHSWGGHRRNATPKPVVDLQDEATV